ncbi:MAG: hypothetical protein ABIQ60_02670 [Burkholderiaceae bacterium]
MDPTHFAQYRGFEFQCSPQRLGPRAFAARLVISGAHGSMTVEIPISVQAPPFETPTAAAHQAFAHGRRWVDNGCDPAALAAGFEAVPTPLQSRLTG